MQIEQQIGLGRQSLRIRSEDEKGEQIGFREQMLLHNRIEGLLPVDILFENGIRVYEYSVPGLESLRSYCRGHKMGLTQLRTIFTAILKSVYNGHEFMLSEDDYAAGPDTIYTDGKERTELVYFPGYAKPLREQLRDLAEFMIDNVDYKDDAAVMMIYSFYMKTKDESCTIEVLMGLLTSSDSRDERIERDSFREERPEPVSPRSRIGDGMPVNERFREEALLEAAARVDSAAFREVEAEAGIRRPSAGEVIKQSPPGLKAVSVMIPIAVGLLTAILFTSGIVVNERTGSNDVVKSFLILAAAAGAIVVTEKLLWGSFIRKLEESIRKAGIEGDGATVMLCGDGMGRYPFSLVSDEYPSINAGKFPFFVGKDPNAADYVLNRAGVSRYHLKIDREGEQYTISDLASTNGTYLNGTRLEPYRAQTVRRGDEVRIGACIFYCN